MSRVIVFDLDDTLYLERDYVRSGIRAVGNWVRTEHGVEGFAEAAWRHFLAGVRGRIFDAGLADLGITPTRAFMQALVGVYRCHEPEISLQPDAAAWLAAPPARTALALLTDGPVDSQLRKIAALGLDGTLLWPQVLSDNWGSAYRKPHPRGFRHIERAHAVAGRDCVYVGDNAAKDFLAPRALGWRTVQIVRSGIIHSAPPPAPAYAADAVITALTGLNAVLERDFV